MFLVADYKSAGIAAIRPRHSPAFYANLMRLSRRNKDIENNNLT